MRRCSTRIFPEYGGNAGKLMLENYRDATSTDIYICSGEEGEV